MANLLKRRRTDPFSPLFGEWMNDLWNRPGLATMPRYADMPAVERALMDVVDKGDHFEVKVDMPGVKKDDIEVSYRKQSRGDPSGDADHEGREGRRAGNGSSRA